MYPMRTLLSVLSVVLVTACDNGSEPDIKVTDTSTQAPYTIVSTTTLLAQSSDSTCSNGGVLIEVGFDANGNAKLDTDEVDADQTVTVCHGLNANSTLVEIADEPAGENCLFGGDKLTIGIDANFDAALTGEEIDQTSYICSNTKTLVQTALEGPGDNCPFGGNKIETGVDLNADGSLEESEVYNVDYICPNQLVLVDSHFCGGGLAAQGNVPNMNFEYRIDEYFNGEIEVTAEIRTPFIGVSKTSRWSPWISTLKTGWLTATGIIYFDASSPANGGYWTIGIDRLTDGDANAKPWIEEEDKSSIEVTVRYVDETDEPTDLTWQTNLAACAPKASNSSDEQ